MKRINHVGGRDALAHANVGERRQRALQIEGGGEQRLGGVGGGAGDHADAAAAPALVEQLHRARRAFAGDFKPRNVVAEFDREIERRFGFAFLGFQRERRFAEQQSLHDRSARTSSGVFAARMRRAAP